MYCYFTCLSQIKSETMYLPWQLDIDFYFAVTSNKPARIKGQSFVRLFVNQSRKGCLHVFTEQLTLLLSVHDGLKQGCSDFYATDQNTVTSLLK